MAVVVTVIASGVGSKTVDPDAISSPVEAPLSVDEKAVLRKRKYVAACLFGEPAAVSIYTNRTARAHLAGKKHGFITWGNTNRHFGASDATPDARARFGGGGGDVE